MDQVINQADPVAAGAARPTARPIHLRVEGVTKRFGAFTALDAVSLEVESGKLVCFLGPSGCGKTTLLRVIAGLEVQDAGAIEIGARGYVCKAASEDVLRHALALAVSGEMPLPPYIASRRPPDAEDRLDYQTIFAREEGAVAAPTAGLHFTGALMDALRARGRTRRSRVCGTQVVRRLEGHAR
jgi:energy-coupling factor transporter ATP-binding protein EcfA2